MAHYSSTHHNAGYHNEHVAHADHAHWRPAHRTSSYGSPLGRFFDNKELPMYKDKPHGYLSSARSVPAWRRKRIYILAALCLTLLWYFFRSHPSTPLRLEETTTAADLGALVEKAQASEDWQVRQEAVRQAFKQSWDAYEKYAWGTEEFDLISKSNQQTTPKGMGWLIVDSLDTLMIMNLTSRLAHARKWVTTSLNYTQDQGVSTFDTTVRMLGGLLAAHYLSNTFPEMAPLREDDPGQAGEDLYIERATDLADRVLGALDSHSGVPFARINLATRNGMRGAAESGATSTAEAGSLLLELKYMSMLTGEALYWEAAEQIARAIDDNAAADGLVPSAIDPDTGAFAGSHIRTSDAAADSKCGASYYAQLAKQYLQTDREEAVYGALWDEALGGVRKHLVTYSQAARLTLLAERPAGLGGAVVPRMAHAACALPGTIVLGATGGATVSAVRKANRWGPRHEGELHLARELAKTCRAMSRAPAAAAASAALFAVDNPPLGERDGPITSEPIDWQGAALDDPWLADFLVDTDATAAPADGTAVAAAAESLFYLFRLTGDAIYRQWAWDLFVPVAQRAAAALSASGVAGSEVSGSLDVATLARSLKFFFLLFGPADALPLDSVVFNAAAHPLPVFRLQRGLKTGWERKPRKSDEAVAPASVAE